MPEPQAPDRPVVADLSAPGQRIERPYPGLRPFQRQEAEYFFGREEHVDNLLEILDRQHFLSVTGPSGSGKSSLVLAGLLPMLPLRTIGEGKPWRYAYMRPGDRPIRSLIRALLAESAFGMELRQSTGSASDYSEQTAEAELSRGPLGLVSLVNDARRHIADGEERDGNLLLLVDQFEEIFTYADAGARQADEADAFVELLLQAHKARTARIFVVLTMRSDFLGDCVRFLNLPEVINRSQYLTPRMSRDQLTRAIINPARMLGGDLDPDLATELVNSVANDPDQLPVLQHALARMWDSAVAHGRLHPQLDISDLNAVGGVAHALARHADVILEEQLSARQQCVAEWLFRAITDQRSGEAGGQMIRRPQSLTRIAAWAGMEWTTFLPVLEAFGAPDVNFLAFAKTNDSQRGTIVPAHDEATVVDISHEALMRQWGKLKKWIVCEHEAGRQFRELLNRAEEAEQNENLLTGPALRRALEWTRTGLRATDTEGDAVTLSVPTAAWATRYVPNGASDDGRSFARVTKFIVGSEQSESKARRRDHRVKVLLYSLAATAFVLALGVGVFGYRSVQQSRIAGTNRLWAPFRDAGSLSIDPSSPPSEDVLRGLVEVARAKRADRERFIVAGFADSTLTTRLLDSTVLKAVIGLDDGLREMVLARLSSGRLRDVDSAAKPGAGGSNRRNVPAAVPLFSRQGLAIIWLGGHPTINQALDALAVYSDVAQTVAIDSAVQRSAKELRAAPPSDLLPRMQAVVTQLRNGSWARVNLQLSALSRAILVLQPAIDSVNAAGLAAEALVAAAAKTTSPRYLTPLTAQFRPLVARLDSATASRLIAQTSAAIWSSNYMYQGTALGTMFAHLAAVRRDSTMSRFAAQLADSIIVVTGRVDASSADGQPAMAFSLALSSISDRLDRSVASVLVDRLRKARGTRAANRSLIEAVTSRLKYGPSVDTIPKFDVADAVKQAQAMLASGVDATEAERLLGVFAAAIPTTTDLAELGVLRRGVRAVARQVDGRTAETEAAKMISAMPRNADSTIISTLGDGVAALIPRIDPNGAAELSLRIVDAIGTSIDTDVLGALNELFVAMSGRVADARLAPINARALQLRRASIDEDRSATLDVILLKLMARLNPRVVEARTDALIQFVAAGRVVVTPAKTSGSRSNDSDPFWASTATQSRYCWWYGYAPFGEEGSKPSLAPMGLAKNSRDLAALARTLEPAAAKTRLHRVIALIDSASDPNRVCALREPLSVLASRIDSASAVALLPRFRRGFSSSDSSVRRALEDTTTADSTTQRYLREAVADAWLDGLVGLRSALPKAESDTALAAYLVVLDSAKSEDRIAVLRAQFHEMVGRTDSARVVQTMDVLLDVIRRSQRPSMTFVVSHSANDLLARASLADDARVKDWIDACKIPFIDRAAVTAAVRRGVQAAPREAEGQWGFFAWAAKNYDIQERASLPPRK